MSDYSPLLFAFLSTIYTYYMVKNYQDIWVRWIGFLQSDLKIRKETLDFVHLEVKQGVTVIAKASLEELEHILLKTTIFNVIKADLDVALSYSVWCGYMLFLISEGIDPVENNLVGRTQTNELGNVWVGEYEKDKCESVLLETDPILSLFLQNASQNELNQILTKHPDQKDISYAHAGQIASFLQWAMHQGYALGVIEQKLFTNKEAKHERT